MLIVEDDVDTRSFMRDALTDEGATVHAYADARSALELALKKPVDLAIVDWGLPRIDGEGAAAALRSLIGDKLPVILVTAQPRPGAKAESMNASAYLAKPFSLDRFLDVIDACLEQRARPDS